MRHEQQVAAYGNIVCHQILLTEVIAVTKMVGVVIKGIALYVEVLVM